jgi:hypothetical protein
LGLAAIFPAVTAGVCLLHSWAGEMPFKPVLNSALADGAWHLAFVAAIVFALVRAYKNDGIVKDWYYANLGYKAYWT